MEKLLNDFLKGEEVKMLKGLIAQLNTIAMVGVVLGYLILLDLLPRFTIIITVLAAVSLFAVHFIKKWSKGTPPQA